MNISDVEAAQEAWEKAVQGMGLQLPAWHSLGPMLAALESFALSHAAGQDGEQCRAASGESGDVPLAVIQAACDEYARVGKEQAGEAEYFPDAMEAAIKAALRALSRGVPEGMVLVPRSSAEMAAVVCDEWGELFVGTPGFDKYERFNYGPAVEMLRDELRAIAAQRKEGG